MRKTSVIALLLALGVSLGAAQAPKTPARIFTIKGTVVDLKGRAVGLALVYLKETRSRMLRIKRAERDGHFTFTRLSGQFDYEIYAEQQDMVSETARVSDSEQKPEVVVHLKLSRRGQ